MPLPASNSSMLAILIAFSRITSDDSWAVTATTLSSLLFSSNDVFVTILRLVFGSVELLDSSLSFPSSSSCDSSIDAFVIIRLLMFCAFELLNSSLFFLDIHFLTRLPLHGCFPSVSCLCSQLLSLLTLQVSFSGLTQCDPIPAWFF